jgi:hypothetical protein
MCRALGDLFWPTAPEVSKEEIDKLDARCLEEQRAVSELKDDEPALEQALDSSEALIVRERERATSVDSRLGSLLSMAAVATALVLGTVTFLTKSDDHLHLVGWSIVVVAALGTYVVVQLLNAIGAAIRGLGRSSVEQDTFLSLLPDGKEARGHHVVRVLHGHARTRRDLSLRIDDKVTCMAIAHRAMKNMTVAMVLGALALFVATVQRAFAGQHGLAQPGIAHDGGGERTH